MDKNSWHYKFMTKYVVDEVDEIPTREGHYWSLLVIGILIWTIFGTIWASMLSYPFLWLTNLMEFHPTLLIVSIVIWVITGLLLQEFRENTWPKKKKSDQV